MIFSKGPDNQSHRGADLVGNHREEIDFGIAHLISFFVQLPNHSRMTLSERRAGNNARYKIPLAQATESI